MGWRAVTKDNLFLREEDGITPDNPGGGRPMEAGESGTLKCIAEESFGHAVAVDLINGVIAIDYKSPLRVQNGTIELDSPSFLFWILEGETNIVGEYKHRSSIFEPWFKCAEPHLTAMADEGSTNKDEPCSEGHERIPLLHADGTPIVVKTDYETPITWRPIWFTRMTNGVPTKVIGAQTTTPDSYGARNVKMMVSLFVDGRVGISG